MPPEKAVIALDAMGGDFGPKPIVQGALDALPRMPGARILLVGFAQKLEEILASINPGWKNLPVEIVPAEAVDEMGDSKFALARRRKESSMQKCAQLVKEGKADAALSAGSTAASVIWSLQILGAHPTPESKPAIPIPWPHSKGYTTLLDAGAGSEADAATLAHFAAMGYIYTKYTRNIERPTVGLLSIGEEKSKGNAKIREAYRLIEERLKEDFKGMVEGKDLAKGKVDVVVCDGFMGNIAVKLGEGLLEELGRILKANLSPLGKLGALLMLPDLKKIKAKLSWETYGAMPLLGVNGAIFIAHGKSTPKAITNGLLGAYHFIQTDALKHIKSLTTPAAV